MARKSTKSSTTTDHRLSDARRLSERVTDRVSPSRSTLRVAAANRVLNATLDRVSFMEAPARVSPSRVVQSLSLDPRSSVTLDRRDLLPSVVTPSKAVPVKPSRLDPPLDRPAVALRKDVSHCKERPDDSRKRGSGGGTPRDFIPWCSKRS